MRLTSREREVITLMKQGFTNKEIAQVLQCKIKTVKTHVTSIYRQYGLSPAAWAPKGTRCIELGRLQ